MPNLQPMHEESVMSGVSNANASTPRLERSGSFASNPELSRGLSKLYSDLRADTEKNGGSVRGGFEKGFTSADGLVTVTLSTESLAAYKGDSKDIGIQLNVLTRSGKGADAATSQGSAMSDPIRSVDDIAAHETSMQQELGPTETLDPSSIKPLPQPPENAEEKAARLAGEASQAGVKPQQAKSGVSGSGTRLDRMKAHSDEGARLAEQLKKSLGDANAQHADSVAEMAKRPAEEQAASAFYKRVDLKT
ncbi:hypothetical protein [Azospirillum palustre]|nr:hypothetical protein [Azospirillum palustre]